MKKQLFGLKIIFHYTNNFIQMRSVSCPICGENNNFDVIYPERLPSSSEQADYSARKAPDNYHYEMVRCSGCGLLYAHSIYESEKINQLYQTSEFKYDAELKNLQETYGRYLEAIDEFSHGKDSLLEIGCGNGFLLEKALSLGYKNVTGVELSSEAINMAVPGVKEKIIQGAFNPDDFEDNQFDVIFFAMVIEHVDDVNKFLQGIYRLLKPGGIVLGITHDEGSLLSAILKDKCPIINDEHVYVFDRVTLSKIFSKNNFAVKKIDDVDNTYSLNYWFKMMPLPKMIKKGISKGMSVAGFGKLNLKLKAGNIFVAAQKIEKTSVREADNQAVIQCTKTAKELRKMIVEISYRAGAHHLGSCLSCIDILSALYFHTLKIDPKNPCAPERDWFILSKGHAAQAQYVALAKRGFFSNDILNTFLQDGSGLGAHPDKNCVPGVEVSSGSLGQGLSIGIGVALAAKKDNSKKKVFVLLGDGECNEGMVWEAAMFAGHNKMDNLVAIVDYNRLQGFGTTDEVMNLDSLSDKFKAFGWEAREVDGHNMTEVIEAFDNLPFVPGKPNVIIAHTVKGKGISFLENKLESHYVSLDEEKYKQALEELK